MKIRVRHPDGVVDQLDVALARQTQTGRAMSALAIPMVIAVLAGELSRIGLVCWAAVMALEALVDIVWARPRAAALAAGTADPTWRRRALPHYASFGLAWGSLPLFALIGGDAEALWLSIVISLAILTVYVVTTAASRVLFAIGAAGITGQMAAAIALTDALPARLGALAVVYAGIVVVVHHALNRSLVDSVRLQRRAEQLAAALNEFVTDHDPATQLLNRRSFIARLDATLAERAARHSDTLVAVEVGNVRRLTAINELYGEQFGNALLAHIGERLGSIPERHGFAARLSGDEFVVAITTSDPDCSIRSLAAGSFTWEGRTTSIDFATASTEMMAAGTTAEELVAEAVFALRSERHTRGTGQGGRHGDTAQSRRDLVDELRHGLRLAGVRPWFQPIVDAESREVVAWEALVRWQHPVLGMISPDRLLPLCDMGGLNGELLELLLVDAAALLLRLDAAGAPPHAVHLNINAGDLRDRSMPDTVLGAIQDARLAHERIVLELTEREILHVDHVERNALGRLDAGGVHIAVDDFGTGYSSLSHLLDFPADHIKIDRRFVGGLPDDVEALALVRGVVSMAAGLGLTTVAEGVETEAAARTVQELGCDQLQGYLFAPALPADQAIVWWQDRRDVPVVPARH